MKKEEIKNLFKDCEELAQAKKVFREWAKKLHPDKGGDEETFKILNEVYHHILDNELYFSSSAKFDTGLEKVISKILHFENINIEIIGSWIWVSGETKDIKEALKEIGFKWASKKKMWYFGEMKKGKRGKEQHIEDIRHKYGSQKIKTNEREKIAA